MFKRFFVFGIARYFFFFKIELRVLPDISSSLRLNYMDLQTNLSWASMNHGDVFILDMGRQIYVWNGREAGCLEKIKGLDVARRIKDEERGGRAALEVVG